jgi:hypothetical protein
LSTGLVGVLDVALRADYRFKWDMPAHRRRSLILPLLSICAVLATSLSRGAAAEWFKIKAVDEVTGRGVPMVELETVNHIRLYTDSNGLAAFHEPGLMNQTIFFHVRSHGYEFAKDRFGYRGIRLKTTPGGEATLKLKRLNVAERIYRITGGGIYRDSRLLGEPVPIEEPLLNGRVFGQDSVVAVRYRGKILWIWGDTNRPRYPLGQFHVSGALSDPPGEGGLDPSVGVNLRYFVNKDGFSKKMCPLPGKGVVWIETLMPIADESGTERIVARYMRMKNLGERLGHGLAVYNDEKEVFEKIAEFDLKNRWRHPAGPAIRVKEEDGDYFYFAKPFPTVRVKVDFTGLKDPDNYEAFTCLKAGSGDDIKTATVERNAKGAVVYGWKQDAAPTGPAEEQQLIRSGRLQAEEARFLPVDVESGKRIHMHSGSVNWNAHRQKWIQIAVQAGGDSSYLGEVWYSEADSLTGPWRNARKIVTHDKYTFYNPKHHAFFDQEGGRFIYFEGTYASTFSRAKFPTPRYDYNQMMYRLDLDDPRLKLGE